MLDQTINAKISLIQSNSLNELMLIITTLGDKILIAIFSLILIAFLLSKKEYIKTKVFAISLVLAASLTYLLKYTIQRPRPESIIINELGYSFPSGHAVLSTVFFGMLIYLFASEIKNKKIKYLFVSLNVLMILLISFSRIYLNVHYITDIIGGIILGLTCIFISIILKEKIPYLKKEKLY